MKYEEIIPSISKTDSKIPLENKYVCIAEFSTANSKHWHYPHINSKEGWQKLVDWLNHNGYKVMVISKQHTHLDNIIDRTGNFPLSYRVLELLHCDFFIGVGSGLSWLSWALGKKVVMISGFSDPICEFKENNIRIINTDVCNSCFNKYKFDKGDWNWCPVHKGTDKQFECTKTITPEMVISKIIENKLVKDNGIFDFKEYDDFNLPLDDIEVSNKGEKITISYKNNKPIEHIHIDIIDIKGELISNFRNTILDKDTTLWTIIPTENDIVILNFFNNKKSLLKINYMLKK